MQSSLVVERESFYRASVGSRVAYDSGGAGRERSHKPQRGYHRNTHHLCEFATTKTEVKMKLSIGV